MACQLANEQLGLAMKDLVMKLRAIRFKSDTAAVVFLCFSFAVLVFSYGAISYSYKLFPQPQIATAIRAAKDILVDFNNQLSWYYFETNQTKSVIVHNRQANSPASP
jgi:hypothetical protein